MKRSYSLILALTLVAGLVLSSAALAGKSTTTPVTSTVLDLDANFMPYSIHSDSIASGIYKNGVDSVISQLQSSQEWELSALSSPARTMYVNFKSPVDPNNMNAPLTEGWVMGRFVTKCYLRWNTTNGPGYPAVGNMTGLDSTRACPMVFRFDLNGVTYRVEMNSVQYAGTDEALITCTGVVSGTSNCNQWRIEPNGSDPVTGQKRNLVRLIKLATVKGKTTDQILGDYYMTFNVGISNP